ncbi:MAG: excinuclease ABC subunit C, partial [Alphaproteobacteria bacterium]
GPEGMRKAAYRKWSIKGAAAKTTAEGGDDFAMMSETLTRRFKRGINERNALAEKGEADPNWPDIVMLDGGKGQLSAVQQVFDELQVTDVTLCAIAKGTDRDAGRETIFMAGQTPFKLEHNDPVLFFIQRLRDEAHRFAIGTHRAKRAKSMSKSALDEVPGIGPKRKKALLLHFGSAKAVTRAGLQDL